MTAPESFFEPAGGDSFQATELTRGPWSREHQHGGPTAGLLGRAIERRFEGLAFQVSRVTLEILRPLPIARVSVATEVVRAGKAVREVRAVLTSGEKELARMTGIAIRVTALELPRSFAREAPLDPPERCPAYEFPFFTEGVGYDKAMEQRAARGRFGEGAFAIWMRMRAPLLPGEAPSPLQRVLVAADSGNGISLGLDTRRWSFVNPDLTVHLHRPLEGEWVGLDARTTAWGSGVGLAECHLSDPRGPIGVSLQSLVVESRGPAASPPRA